MLTHTKPNRHLRTRGCAHCHFTGWVTSATLATQIRCPICSRHPRQDRSGIKALTAGERRRVEQVLQRAALTVARDELLAVELPIELLTTDRILMRWAVGHGSGLPFSDDELEELAEAAAEHSDTFTGEQAKPPPLDDRTQTVVDQIVGPDPDVRVRSALLRADPGAGLYRRLRGVRSVEKPIARFVWQWYCKPVPCSVMSAERAMDERGLYAQWQSVLLELRGLFVASAHEDLVGLVRMLV